MYVFHTEFTHQLDDKQAIPKSSVCEHGAWQFKTQYYLHAKKKTRNGHGKHGGCDSKHNITCPLRRRKRNEHGEHGGCDSKHNITYFLRKRKQEMDIVSMEDMIQNTISLAN